MRLFKYLFFSLLLVGIPVYASMEADEYYNKGDYLAALSLYQHIKHPSRSVYYAMGACSYHLGDDAQALAYWKKAERGASTQLLAAIDKGMEHLYMRAGKTYQVSWYTRVLRRLAVIPLLFIQLFILLSFLIQVSFRSYFMQHKRLGMSIRFVMILGIISMSQISEQPIGSSRASAVVRAGPGGDYPIISELSLFDEVTIEDKNDTWYKIKHSKIKGWVEKNAVACA